MHTHSDISLGNSTAHATQQAGSGRANPESRYSSLNLRGSEEQYCAFR